MTTKIVPEKFIFNAETRDTPAYRFLISCITNTVTERRNSIFQLKDNPEVVLTINGVQVPAALTINQWYERIRESCLEEVREEFKDKALSLLNLEEVENKLNEIKREISEKIDEIRIDTKPKV